MEKSSVQVAVRVRPGNMREAQSQSIITVLGNQVFIKNPEDSKMKTMTYDSVFDEAATQQQIFNSVGERAIEAAFLGYNTCIFAYGQTGSGKSHTMMGSPSDIGLIPRICRELFERQGNNNGIPRDGQVKYRVELSYLEIYCEQVRDLLGQDHLELKVREHPETGPYVEGLSKMLVTDTLTIKKLIDQGNRERITAATLMNERSSRSHAILTLYFGQTILTDDPLAPPQTEIISQINLVDLAGSERVDQSGVTGINFNEMKKINLSLTTLGIVINKLVARSLKHHEHHEHPKSDKQIISGNAKLVAKKPIKPGLSRVPTSQPSKSNTQKILASPREQPARSKSPVKLSEHVPFRDSVLTWILKESLGGNSKTFMIATISPSSLNYSETLGTLRYADNAKKIINSISINQSSSDKINAALQDEVERLRRQIATNLKAASNERDQRKIADLTTENQTLQEQLQQLETLVAEREKTAAARDLERSIETQKLVDKITQELREQNRIQLEAKEAEIRHQMLEYEKLAADYETAKADGEKHAALKQQMETELQVKVAEMQEKQEHFQQKTIVNASIELNQYYEQKLAALKHDYEQRVKSQADHTIEEYKKRYDNMAELYTRAVSELEEARDSKLKLLESFNRERQSLEKELVHTKEIYELKLSQQNAGIAMIDLLQTGAAKKDEQINEQKEQLAKCQTEIAEYKSKISELNTAIALNKSDVENIREQLLSCKEHLTNSRAEILSLKTDNDNLKEQLSRAKEQLNSNESSKQTSTYDKQALVQQIENLKQSLEVSQHAYEDLKSASSNIQTILDERETLIVKVDDQQKQIAKLQGDLNRKSSQFEQFVKQSAAEKTLLAKKIQQLQLKKDNDA